MTVVSLYATSKKQVDKLERRIIADGYELLEEYKFVGRGLESLRYRAAKGQIDTVYVYSPDDLSEKFAKQVMLVREFHEAGVEIIFLNHETKSLVSSLLWKSQWAMEKYRYKVASF